MFWLEASREKLPFHEAAREAEEILDFVVSVDRRRCLRAPSLSRPKTLGTGPGLATGAEVILLDENMAGLNPRKSRKF